DTPGITAKSTGAASTISLASIKLGSNIALVNNSPAPTSTTPSFNITSPIDLAGKTLTNGTGGTSDTGLSLISSVISSSASGTTAIVENGGGLLALSGANTFAGAVNVQKGILVDAGNNALGATSGAGTTVSSGAFLGLSNG